MPRLSLSLLGPFVACLDDARLTDFRTDKMRALLAYLAVEAGVPHRRETLASLLWPDQPESDARQNLRQAISRLGRAIGNRDTSPPYLLITPKTVTFNPESDHWLDVSAFTDQIEAVRHHHHRRAVVCRSCMRQLEQAVTLYRGSFLEGLTVEGGLAFDEWQLFTQEQLHNQAMEALRLLGDYAECHQSYTDVIRYSQRQLVLEPWREAAHRQLMRALTLSDQRGAALAQYETCRNILAEELQAVPEDATIELYQEILAGDKALEALRPYTCLHNLPLQLTPFVGRMTELTQIIHHLSNPDCRLLTVLGPGGVGKTRLALQAAAELRYDFPDGVWFVPLASVSSPDLLVSSIAQVLGVEIEKGADPKIQLLDYLSSRDILLILDNFEHLVEAADLLLDILKAAPDVYLLVTSRERLNYQAEFLLTLEGLPYPAKSELLEPEGQNWGPQELSGFANYEAVQLFMERGERVQAGFNASADTLPHIARVCQLVEGLPLGIELAAAQLRNFSPAEIAENIQENLDIMATSMRDIPPRQLSIRATFEHSWNLLSEGERDVYRQCSVFQGSFTPQAALSIISNQISQAPKIMDALVSKSLVRREATGRYELHPVLKQFSSEKLNGLPVEANEVHSRHAHYYLKLLHEREAGILGEGSKEALEEIQGELGNIRASWKWSVGKREIDLLHQSAATLAYFYNRTGQLQEGERVFRSATEQITAQKWIKTGEEVESLHEKPVSRHSVSKQLLARLHLEQARFLFGLGKYTHLSEHAQAAISLAASCQDRVIEGLGNLYWGFVYHNQGEWQQARTRFERALSLAKTGLKDLTLSAGDHQRSHLREIEARSLNGLAMVSKRQGNYDEAEKHLLGSLQAAREADDLAGQCRALNGLGTVASQRGDFSKALVYYQEALYDAQACGYRSLEGALLNNLGNMHLRLGIYDEAGNYYKRALEIQRKIGAHQKEISARINLGLAHHLQGAHETAYSYIHQAKQIAEEVGDRRAIGFAWMGSGHANFGLGLLDKAREAYQHSIILRRDLGQLNLVAEPLAGLVRVAMAQNQEDFAMDNVEKILDLTGDCTNLDGLIDPFLVCLTCYQVLKAYGDPRAFDILHRAHQQLQERAEKISEENFRSSFMENVASHRELVKLYDQR